MMQINTNENHRCVEKNRVGIRVLLDHHNISTNILCKINIYSSQDDYYFKVQMC